MKPRKLLPTEELELAREIELRQKLRRELSDKALCEKYGIGPRTLWDIVARVRSTKAQKVPRETACLMRFDAA